MNTRRLYNERHEQEQATESTIKCSLSHLFRDDSEVCIPHRAAGGAHDADEGREGEEAWGISYSEGEMREVEVEEMRGWRRRRGELKR